METVLAVPSTFYVPGRGTWKEGVEETGLNQRRRPVLWARAPAATPPRPGSRGFWKG